MGTKKVSGRIKGNMAFETNLDGHILITDASEEIGGENLGPRPKMLLLAGLIGCTGIDVVSILKKMKVDLEDFKIDIEAIETDEYPIYYKEIHLIYTFKGNNLPEQNLKRAVNLSQEKYCGVAAMLGKAAVITYEIKIEEF